MENDFYQACNVFLQKNPNGEIIYNGEGPGGCCADDEFFENYDLEDLDINYQSVCGIHDNFFIAKKKKL